MKTLFAITLATIYGLSIRLFFGFLDAFMGIMSVSFLIIVPMLIGFLTILLMPKEKITGNTSAFFIPWLTSLAILVVTILLNVEGTICWIMIYPLFSILAGIGGIIAYNIKKEKYDDTDDDWKNRGTLKLSLLLLISPLLLGLLEEDRTLTRKEMIIAKEVIIHATPAEVWEKLVAINEIALKDKKTSFSNALGFPRHLRTTLDTLAVGGKRIAYYENGLYFDETISKYEPEHLLVLKIKTDPSKIPPNVLDEHIVIGGKHVDILEDIYTIEPLANGNCRLLLSSKFIISTPFNWYTSIWANYLMGDLLEGEINLIKKRVINKI
jgi:hypothetical protein